MTELDTVDTAAALLRVINDNAASSVVVNSLIANNTRRCTGFKPSRTSGNARPTITLMA